jgi:hypothetical protein
MILYSLFQNRLSILNTDFIRFCQELDSRVRPLMIAVRMVAKRHDLAGGGGGQRISNYALTMLVIFCLEQLEPRLLHPLHTLLQEFQGQPEVINGWACSFSTEVSRLPFLPVNKKGVLKLLTGFFKFYTGFHFNSKIICPRIGRTLPRDVTLSGLPPELRDLPPFLGGKAGLPTNTPICLQDPFELNFNICRNLLAKALHNFGAVMTIVIHSPKQCQLFNLFI